MMSLMESHHTQQWRNDVKHVNDDTELNVERYSIQCQTVLTLIKFKC